MGFGWLVMVGALAAVGCGASQDPHGRHALSGTVVFQERPLDAGSIRFQSVDKDGLSAGALIRDGKYLIPREQGLVPGAYLVQISALEPTPKPTGAPGENPAPPAKERIPAEYNSKTQQKIELKAGQEGRFDFTIP